MKFSQYSFIEGLKINLEKMGFVRPTDIQFKSIPPILKGEDVLAIAQTGTGKTAAFAIPIINSLHLQKKDKRPNGIRCLVMAPTHELALQIHTVFTQLCKHTKVDALCIYGGVEQDPQIKQLQKGVDILIATPGRLFDLVSQGELNLSKVEILVLDEADHMLDLGFINDIKSLMRHIPKKRQTLFFSATINEKIKKLAYSLVTDAIRIQIAPKDPVAKNIDHAVAHIKMDDKRFFLAEFIRNNVEKKTLVFVRTKVRAERVKKALHRFEIESDTIHSDKEQTERENAMQNFRGDELKVLIATDVSARGIDIPNVEFVINYDLPESSEQYVHRVGRTGRGTKKGIAISFCGEDEKDLLKEIESNLGKPISVMEIAKSQYELTVKTVTENPNDWRALMDEAEDLLQHPKRRKRKK